MPQISSVCSRASWWNGQFRNTTMPSSSEIGSKPWASSASSTAARVADPVAPTDAPSQPGPDLVGEPPALGARGIVECRLDVGPVAARPVGGLGEQAPGEGVVAPRQRHVDLAAGPPVELGRPPRARALTTRQPLVVDVEQPVGREPVEVMGGGAALDPDGLGRPVTTDPIGAGDDEVVERASGGFAEGTDRGDRVSTVPRDRLVHGALGHHVLHLPASAFAGTRL